MLTRKIGALLSLCLRRSGFKQGLGLTWPCGPNFCRLPGISSDPRTFAHLDEGFISQRLFITLHLPCRG
jgi:hypothetical protein